MLIRRSNFASNAVCRLVRLCGVHTGWWQQTQDYGVGMWCTHWNMVPHTSMLLIWLHLTCDMGPTLIIVTIFPTAQNDLGCTGIESASTEHLVFNWYLMSCGPCVQLDCCSWLRLQSILLLQCPSETATSSFQPAICAQTVS
ncbi:unnamed protein product [Ixodes pacificus]